MKHFHWLNTARHWIGGALHWSDLQSILHEGPQDDSEPEWVVVYETACGFCCFYHDQAIEFPDIDDFRAWAESVGVRLYFLGL